MEMKPCPSRYGLTCSRIIRITLSSVCISEFACIYEMKSSRQPSYISIIWCRYGLGALVAGRVIEVLYQRLTKQSHTFGEIMSEFLFQPLNMSSAAFFLPNDDPRVEKMTVLYGGKLRDSNDYTGGKGCDVLPFGECVPEIKALPNTVATDSFQVYIHIHTSTLSLSLSLSVAFKNETR